MSPCSVTGQLHVPEATSSCLVGSIAMAHDTSALDVVALRWRAARHQRRASTLGSPPRTLLLLAWPTPRDQAISTPATSSSLLSRPRGPRWRPSTGPHRRTSAPGRRCRTQLRMSRPPGRWRRHAGVSSPPLQVFVDIGELGLAQNPAGHVGAQHRLGSTCSRRATARWSGRCSSTAPSDLQRAESLEAPQGAKVGFILA
jgi:hypothetical protein